MRLLPRTHSCAIIISVLAAAIGSSFAQTPAAANHITIICTPDDPDMRSPELARVRLETTRGIVRIELHRSWAPHGVDRFYNLVSRGYYDNSAIFRVLAGRFAQFGISGTPNIAQAWRTRTIPDDPRIESNVRGTVFFAFKEANGRTTQVVINLRDNSEAYDKEPFVPIGKVIEGMNVADAFYAEYGESALGGIRGGKQDPLFKEGNDYLKRNFPRLDYIVKATIEKTK
jgi:cyclophilin family peptidyl-prolyl cis-trans isomerase